MPNSDIRLQIQLSSDAALATARYSASGEDRATPFCYLDVQDMG